MFQAWAQRVVVICVGVGVFCVGVVEVVAVVASRRCRCVVFSSSCVSCRCERGRDHVVTAQKTHKQLVSGRITFSRLVMALADAALRTNVCDSMVLSLAAVESWLLRTLARK